MTEQLLTGGKASIQTDKNLDIQSKYEVTIDCQVMTIKWLAVTQRTLYRVSHTFGSGLLVCLFVFMIYVLVTIFQSNQCQDECPAQVSNESRTHDPSTPSITL